MSKDLLFAQDALTCQHRVVEDAAPPLRLLFAKKKLPVHSKDKVCGLNDCPIFNFCQEVNILGSLNTRLLLPPAFYWFSI